MEAWIGRNEKSGNAFVLATVALFKHMVITELGPLLVRPCASKDWAEVPPRPLVAAAIQTHEVHGLVALPNSSE